MRVFEQGKQPHGELRIGVYVKCKIHQITIHSVIVSPETIVKAHRSRSKPIYIQVVLVHYKTKTTNPAIWNVPPALILSHLRQVILDLLGPFLIYKLPTDCIFCVFERVGGHSRKEPNARGEWRRTKDVEMQTEALDRRPLHCAR